MRATQLFLAVLFQAVSLAASGAHTPDATTAVVTPPLARRAIAPGPDVTNETRESLAGTGAVQGWARAAGTGVPIPFALIRLRAVDRDSTVVRQTITRGDGRFVLGEVPEGNYRLQLLRIGYTPILSPILTIHDGETVHHDLIGTNIPFALPAMMVHPPGYCAHRAELTEDPQQYALWSEAKRGDEIRRAFDLGYSYTVYRVQKFVVSNPGRDTVRREIVDTIPSSPDSVPARVARRRAQSAAGGYGQGTTLVVPDASEVLDDGFLDDHCIESPALTAEGMLGLRFRTAGATDKGYSIRGTIWMDSATHLIRRLQLAYETKGRVVSDVSIEYANVALAGGGTMRLPSIGTATLASLKAPPGAKITGTLSYVYRDVVEARSK